MPNNDSPVHTCLLKSQSQYLNLHKYNIITSWSILLDTQKGACLASALQHQRQFLTTYCFCWFWCLRSMCFFKFDFVPNFWLHPSAAHLQTNCKFLLSFSTSDLFPRQTQTIGQEEYIKNNRNSQPKHKNSLSRHKEAKLQWKATGKHIRRDF